MYTLFGGEQIRISNFSDLQTNSVLCLGVSGLTKAWNLQPRRKVLACKVIIWGMNTNQKAGTKPLSSILCHDIVLIKG